MSRFSFVRRFFWLGLLVGISLGGSLSLRFSAAQSATLTFGETVSGLLDSSQASQNWSFDANGLEIIEIEAFRLGGQFTPRLTLTAPDGTPLLPEEEALDAISHRLAFRTFLGGNGTYTITLTGENITGNVDNPDEYSVTLRQLGIRLPDIQNGLTLPTLGLDPASEIPALAQGSPAGGEDADKLGDLKIYGASQVMVPDRARPQNFEVAGGGNRIDTLQNGSNMSRMISSISFVSGGIGMEATLPDDLVGVVEPTLFFTDQNILRMENTQTTVTLTLANNQVITTDFYRLASIQAVQDLVVLRTREGNRLILSGSTFVLTQDDRSSLNRITLENNQYIVTDMGGWETLAYLPNSALHALTVLSGQNLRFFSDVVKVNLRQRGYTIPTYPPAESSATPPEVAAVDPALPIEGIGTTGAISPETGRLIFDIQVEDEREPFLIQLDSFGMGDLTIQTDEVIINPLDGRSVTEPLPALDSLLLETGGIRFARADGSFRTSYPDFTEIETPATINTDEDLRPNQAGFEPSGHNNLGTDLLPTTPALNTQQQPLPVNPVNGNFYYAVQDTQVPSHTLELEFTRHYNSQDTQATPAYLLNAPNPYPWGKMGAGWRHSLQVDLDLTFAPLGRVTLTLPTGAQHLFQESTQIKGRYLSLTLPMWMVERRNGILGNWVATRTDGLKYGFDAVGRLERITAADGLALHVAPLPREYMTEVETRGFFLMEPYGRRLEIYMDASGQITRLKNADSFELSYSHDGNGELIGVQYLGNTPPAEYGYQSGQLTQVQDAFSPYHQNLAVAYDADGRVVSYDEDASASNPRRFTYAYEEGKTTQTTTVNGLERVQAWEYDPLYLITNFTLPKEGWVIRYDYRDEANWQYRLASYRAPEGFLIRADFNDQGHMTRLLDPSVDASLANTDLKYTTLADGHQQRLDEIVYANNIGYDRFGYDEQNRLISRTTLIKGTPDNSERVIRYEYDGWGRIIALYQPAPDGTEVATSYEYDAFGYVIAINEGNNTRRTSFSHDRVGRLRSFTDGRGNATTISWDEERNLILKIEAPLGYYQTFSYDDLARITQVDDGGSVTNYSYDSRNQVVSVTDALGQTTQYTYDEAGNILTKRLPDETSLFTYTYDSLNYLTSEQTPGGLITTYTTELVLDQNNAASGRLRRTYTDPANRKGTYIYDPGGRLREVRLEDRTGALTYSYNLTPQVLGQSLATERVGGAAGRNTRVEYNLLGLPIKSSINAAEFTYSYNAAGLLASVADPAERVTSYEYDVLGNVIRVTLPTNTEANEPPVTYDYTYDENGNITSVTNGLGEVTEYVYNDLNRLETVIDPLGRQTTYNYDPRGNLISVTDPNGVIRAATYDDLNRLTSITHDAATNTAPTYAYTYDILGRLAEFSQQRVLNIKYTYDLDNNIIAITQPNLNNLLFSYDALGRVTSATDVLGHTDSYEYDRLDRIRSVIDPVGNTLEYRWNSNGRFLRFADEAQRSYVYTFDDVGRLRQITDQNDQNIGINTRVDYDPSGYVTQIRFGSGQVLAGNEAIIHTYGYTAQGWLVSYIDPEAGEWRMAYDLAGNLVEVTNPNGSQTRYTYDAAGQIIQIQRDGAAEFYEYDNNGNVTRYTAPNGLVTDYEYNSSNQVTSITTTDQTGTSRRYLYDYDNLGYIRLIEDPLGNQTRYNFDLFGNLTKVTRFLNDGSETPVEVATSYIYDDVGNIIGVVQPQGNANEGIVVAGEDYRTNLTYNARDLRVRYGDPEANVWAYTYDRDGRLLTISDPLGSEIRYFYDRMGRVSDILYPNGAIFTFAYGARGDLNRVTLGANEIRNIEGRETVGFGSEVLVYRMDRRGNLVAIEEVDGDETTFTYDALGNLISRRDPKGNTTQYTYDAAGNITRITPSGGSPIQRDYDNMGNLTAVSSGGNTYEFTYNLYGDLVSQSAPNLNITYERDAMGNLLKRDAGEFGTTTYTYDTLYRLIKVEHDGESVEFTYNLNGWRESMTRSNGVSTQYVYDTNGRPTQIQHLGPQGLIDLFRYTYDSVGNVVRVERGDGWTILYSYDTAHQLISERWLDERNQTRYSMSIRYDTAGNRVETLVSAEDSRIPTRTLYTYTRENQLDYIVRDYVPPDEFTDQPAPEKRDERRLRHNYDDNGNLIEIIYPEQDGGYRLSLDYDSDNRLIAISGNREDGTAVNTRLTYDPLNRLSEWRATDGNYRFVYDGEVMIGARNLDTGEVLRFFGLTADERLFTLAGDGTEQWFIHDRLNSVRRLTTGEGLLQDNLTASLNINAFGEIIAPYAENLFPTGLMAPQFAGQLYDPTSELYIMGVRAYNPEMGRFIQRDPIRHDPQSNLYTYAHNRPNYFVDPHGTTPQEVLQATAADLIPAELRPVATPQMLINEIPQPPNVQELQADESFRVLAMANAIRLGLNETSGLLSPNLGAFYIYRLNPAPSNILAQSQQPTLEMTELYTPQAGWQQLAPPNPEAVPNPLAALYDSDWLLLQTQTDLLGWYGETPAPTYLPYPDQNPPQVLTPRLENELGLPPLLAEIPLPSGAPQSIAELMNVPDSLPDAAPHPVLVLPPRVAVNPVDLAEVQALQDQQSTFYRDVWFLGSIPD